MGGTKRMTMRTAMATTAPRRSGADPKPPRSPEGGGGAAARGLRPVLAGAEVGGA